MATGDLVEKWPSRNFSSEALPEIWKKKTVAPMEQDLPASLRVNKCFQVLNVSTYHVDLIVTEFIW